MVKKRDSKVIKPVHPKGNQPWIFIGRTDVETLILWPPDAMNWLIGKDPDTGKDWRQEEKGPTEDEMVGWHHQLNGHECEQTLGDSEGQGSLACCISLVAKSQTWLSNWTTTVVLATCREDLLTYITSDISVTSSAVFFFNGCIPKLTKYNMHL